MKKLLTTLLVCITVFACTVSFSACDDGNDEEYSEAFTGVASEQTFETIEEATYEFIVQELCVDEAFTFTSFIKEADLTDTEIASLNLSATDRQNLQAAEKGLVSYSIKRIAESNDYMYIDSREQSVYMLKISEAYKYYVPLPEVGEQLTKSYIDSVLDFSNYQNCTVDYDYTETSSSSVYKMTYSLKTVDNLVELCADERVSWSLYLNDEDYVHVSKSNGEYNATYYYGQSDSWDYQGYEYISAQYKWFLTYTFIYTFIGISPNSFIKTEYGFTYDTSIISDLPIDKLDVYVTGGAIGKYLLESGEVVFDVKVYDFGTTRIDLPSEAEALLYK